LKLVGHRNNCSERDCIMVDVQIPRAKLTNS
jgi:hypothetical protein